LQPFPSRRGVGPRAAPHTGRNSTCLGAVEAHENWIEAVRYLNMDELKEHKKQQLREVA
jgi:hypothetical protein